MLLQDTLKLTDEKSSSFATNRMGAVIEKDSDVYQILSAEDGSLCRLVNCLVEVDEETDGKNEGEELGEMILSPDIPIEVSLLLVMRCLLQSLILHYSIPLLTRYQLAKLTTPTMIILHQNTQTNNMHRFESTKNQRQEWDGTLMISSIKIQNRLRWY